MSLLEYNTTRKGRVDETTTQLKFEAGEKGEEYKVEAIWDSTVYARESEGHLPGLYYLVLWKGYPKEENTWEPALVVQYLRKLISTFHKDYLEKPTATLPPINTALPMVRSTIRPEAQITKWKCGRPAKANGAKRAKKSWEFKFLSRFWLCLSQKQRNFFCHVISIIVLKLFRFSSSALPLG